MEVSQKPLNVSIQFLYLALGMIFSLMWIGDSSFINDEALILNLALKANQNGDFFTLGLMGTKGFQYGPVPIWFYRALLFVTQNIYFLALIKTFLVFCANSIGIYYFFRLLPSWNQHTVVLILFSPFLWFYNRNLWDNSLNITITLWGFVAYFNFFKTRQFHWFALTLLCLVAAFQVHLMSLPFIAAITFHLMVFCHRDLINHWKLLLIVVLCAAFFMKDYMLYLITVPKSSSVSHFTGSLKSFSFPIYGGQFFSLHGFQYFVGKKWFSPIPDFLLSTTGWIIFLPLFGIFKSIQIFYKKFKFKSQYALDDHLALVCLIWFVAFISLSYLNGLSSNPHYYNSSWFLYFVFLNLGLNALWNRAWMKKLFFAHSVTMFIALFSILILLHFRQGTRSLHYGPTLKNQVEVATQINTYDSADQWTSKANHPLWFPHTINLLRTLEPARQSIGQLDRKALKILYAQDNVYDGKIILEP